MSEKRNYDATVARIAGNIASGLMPLDDSMKQIDVETVAETSVMIARAIVAEVKRTEPSQLPIP